MRRVRCPVGTCPCSPRPPAVSSGLRVGTSALATRGLQVETTGEGDRMSFVANLQYDDSGEAQNGSDIEFVRIDGRGRSRGSTGDAGVRRLLGEP